jgi:two-component system response regulator (stage 0 sporulation protein A)
MENVRTVLLADSGEESRLLLRELVESTGEFTVVAAVGDGMEALRLCDQLRPDLVLTEVALPSLDGLGLLRALHDRPQPPQVIMLSAFCNERIMAQAARRGAFYFMAKPVHHASLLEQMHMAVSGNETAEDQSVALERRVTAIFREIGIPAHVKGYRYLREAILMAVDYGDITGTVTKALYPDVAKRFGTTASRVERSMRTAIEMAWLRGDREAIWHYFGSPTPTSWRPSNSAFIATMAEMLRLQEQRRA